MSGYGAGSYDMKYHIMNAKAHGVSQKGMAAGSHIFSLEFRQRIRVTQDIEIALQFLYLA